MVKRMLSPFIAVIVVLFTGISFAGAIYMVKGEVIAIDEITKTLTIKNEKSGDNITLIFNSETIVEVGEKKKTISDIKAGDKVTVKFTKTYIGDYKGEKVVKSITKHIIQTAESNWIITDKGCKIWNPNPKPNESVTWSGKCVDGKTHGNGILIWYQNGIESSRDVITTKNGMMMVEGVMTANVEPSSAVFILHTCDKSTSYRGVMGLVDKEIDLSQHYVALHILEKAAQFAQEKCPRKHPFSNIDVVFYQGDEKQYREYENIKDTRDAVELFRKMDNIYKARFIEARNYDDNKLTWREYNNKALKQRRSEDKTKYDAKVKELQEEKTKQKMAAQRAEEERKRKEIRKRYDEFVKKNGVQAWPSGDELSANPFVYEGKTVAIRAEFKEMLTPTQGIFDYFVVSNIPKGLFTSSRTNVVLAGRVIGKTEVKMGLEMSVPHLKFVGVHFCKNYDCSDILP